MTAVTYDLARIHAREPAKAECEAKAAPRKSFFARYVHLLPYTLDERGEHIVRTDSGYAFGGG